MVADDDFSTRVCNWVVGAGTGIEGDFADCLRETRMQIHVKMGYVSRNVIAVLLGATIVFVSCSRPASMHRPSDVVTRPLKERVPPPDPTKYGSVRDASDWQNPYLTVDANGIQVRQNGVAREGPTMSPDEVVAYLEKLPPIEWPYGLIVGVQESGLRNSGDDIPIKRNREAWEHLLKQAGIKADLWPSG